MNKKGQVLILFVIMMPILLLAIAFAIEVSLIGYHKIKLASVTRTIIKSDIASLEKNDIINLYSENNIEVIDLDVSNGFKVSMNVNSFLGKIINKESYKIRVEVKE